MNPRKGIIGLLATIFLISAISMIMLVIDDRNDLSSRASGLLASNLRPALPGVTFIPNETLWDGTPFRLPITIKYNGVLWMPPKDRNTVFYHTDLPITLRIYNGKVNQSTLGKILGENFTALRNVSTDNTTLPGWSIESFTSTFFGDKKSISVWTNKDGITLISVMPQGLSQIDIVDFAKNIIPSNSSGQVKGVNSEDNTIRLAALVRPSVVMILNNYCSNAKFTSTHPGFVLAGREYPFCIAGVGTGFFVNESGYIATNGHLVKNIPDTSLFYAVASGSLDTLLSDYMQVYTAEKTGTLPSHDEMVLKIKEAHASKENIYQLAGMVSDLYKNQYVELNSSQNNYYVQLGNTPLQLSTNGVNTGKDIVQAKLIDSDYSEPDSVTGFTTSDVAILKIDGDNYPGLPLGSIDDISVGSTIQILGFPGVVMGGSSFLLDSSTNTEPTYTKGVVSAFKQAKGDKKQLIQTDASINHGNSGGPAINSEGKVVGIATYGLTPDEGGGNYNFLRDIQDLKQLMKKNNIAENPGDTYTSWKSGLENFWLSYFKYAETDFQKVSSLYPIHPSVGKYLAFAKEKINTPEDQTPKFSRSQRSTYMAISGGVMALSLFSIIILWIIDRIDSNKRSSVDQTTATGIN